ncbi:DNA (cytosine-5)-methyltransferase 1 [Pseudoclavibacter sp. JAI123]|uniref:DNA cytosine methyltransferase n=1 Tax=Pseudoclavibacter sp. JAI123 TaxID=2723065 RepID=UPI0015C6D72D|nr:DNA cytosine methyltransferase [Pseudoclavibacter sp. JAI123]NYF13907.1 DNA (cytosine-5)-methyltransferase 1 [Pseudoclavibacter sp. JAI123]
MSEILPFPTPTMPRVLEFFAGVGLARMGLQQAGFKTVWANDYSSQKAALYRAQFGDGGHYEVGNVFDVDGATLPDAELAWASSPCTDLSLAGQRTGLAGRESNAFFGFTKALREMGERRPQTIVLENVVGLASSHEGEDLAAVVREFNELEYSCDVLALDARRWVPQSRPRLFVVGHRGPNVPHAVGDDAGVRLDNLQRVFGDPTLLTHQMPISAPPVPLTQGFGNITEQIPLDDTRWWDDQRTAAFDASLSPIQRERVERLRSSPRTSYRTAYRRTRNGVPVWEVRPDDIAGCLRTARGGSSKQAVVRLGHGRMQVRWMTGVEYARLMGAGEYRIDGFRDSEVQFAFGDAVAVPAVGWLAEEYLLPLVTGVAAKQKDQTYVEPKHEHTSRRASAAR